MPSTTVGCGDADQFEDRGYDVDAVRELVAHHLVGLDVARPRHDHRVAGPAQMAGHLLAPLERCVVGVSPCGGEVRGGVEAADLLDAAELLLDDLQLLVGLEHDPVEERRLVERTRDGALHTGAVVTPDVDDERVVEVAHLVDRVEQATDVPVGVLGIAGEDLHLAGVQLLLRGAERVPGGEEVGALGQFGIGRNDAELLLSLERLLAIDVPAVVELALVLVGPFLVHVVRRVAAPGRVVQEPGLVGVLGTNGVQPLDRFVGDVVGEVVELAVLALRHTRRRVVLGDDRVVLTGGAGQEAPPVIEAPAERPVVERSGGAHLAAGRHVPLAESAGDVSVLAQDPRQGGAAPRSRAGVAGEGSRKLGDAAHADAVVVASGEHRGPGRGADGRHVEPVVGDSHLLHPGEVRGRDAAPERVGAAEAGVVDEDDEHVRCAFGRRRTGDERPVGGRRVERVPGRPAEDAVGDRQHGAIGVELAGRFGEGVLEAAHTLLVHRGDRLGRGAAQRHLGRHAVCGVDHRNDRGGARLQLVAHAGLEAAVHLVLGELADDASCRGTDRGRREKRWRGKTYEHADAAAPAHALAAEMAARVGDVDFAGFIARDEDHAVGADLLVLDECDECVEVPLGRLQRRIGRQDEIERIAHWSSYGLLVVVPAYRRLTSAGDSPLYRRGAGDLSRCGDILLPASRRLPAGKGSGRGALSGTSEPKHSV